MYCLKCGRDTTDNHVFCDSCQANMEHYPVKPGTAIHLPKRKDLPTGKKATPRKRAPSPEEQIENLKRNLRTARIYALILLVALSLVSVLLVREFANSDAPAIGQNYTIDTNMAAD